MATIDWDTYTYGDLVSHIKTIQYQLKETVEYLDNRWNNEKSTRDQFQSSSLTIIDPYGNSITKRYMNHEYIDSLLKTFLEYYVPKYFHKYIRFGHLIENEIKPLEVSKHNLIEAKYNDPRPIVSYIEITVWLGDFKNLKPQRIILKRLLNDNIEQIRMHLIERTKLNWMELRGHIIGENTEPNEKNWNEGNPLEPEDTITSKELCANGCIVMANIAMDMVDYRFFLSSIECFTLSLCID